MTTHDDTGSFRRASSAADEIVEQLDARLDLTDRERAIARGVAVLVVEALPSVLPGFGHQPLTRLAALEVWRGTVDAWHLALTGVADGNGRIGNMTRDIAALRADMGTSEECRQVRASAGVVLGVKRKLTAAVAAAAVAVGGGVWSMRRADRIAVTAAARSEANADHNRIDIDRLYQLCGHAAPARTEP